MLKQSSLAGSAEYRTQLPLLAGNPHAVDILIDVLSDRGFRYSWRASAAAIIGAVALKCCLGALPLADA